MRKYNYKKRKRSWAQYLYENAIGGAGYGLGYIVGGAYGGSAGYGAARYGAHRQVKSSNRDFNRIRKNLKVGTVDTVTGSNPYKKSYGSLPTVIGSKPIEKPKKKVTFVSTGRARLRRKVSYKPKWITWRYQ